MAIISCKEDLKNVYDDFNNNYEMDQFHNMVVEELQNYQYLIKVYIMNDKYYMKVHANFKSIQHHEYKYYRYSDKDSAVLRPSNNI